MSVNGLVHDPNSVVTISLICTIWSEERMVKMNGYCGECDKQIEFRKGNIEVIRPDGYEQKQIEIYLVCPWCDEQELITKIDE
jgi:hypothetical protein